VGEKQATAQKLCCEQRPGEVPSRHFFLPTATSGIKNSQAVFRTRYERRACRPPRPSGEGDRECPCGGPSGSTSPGNLPFQGLDVQQVLRSPGCFLAGDEVFHREDRDANTSEDPIQDLRSYVADYLKEEIAAEAAVEAIPAFAEFLRVAALTSGELLNYTNVARESGISAKVVRSYFQILEDTLLGFRVEPWRKSRRRRLIETDKFYLFDVGVSNYLARRTPRAGTPEFGKSFEHFILMELKAYQAYEDPELELRYWRTSTGLEVDFVLGDMVVAVETKGSRRVHEGDLKGIKALHEEHRLRRAVIVCLEDEPRKISPGIEVLPWRRFLEDLWSGGLGV
jgi:hypothetical protein